jgi:adiponectin receptor
MTILPLVWTEFTQSLGFENLLPTLSLWPALFSAFTPSLPIPSALQPFFGWSLSDLSFTAFPPSPADPLPKFLFLLAACACLSCSTAWHTLAGCSDLWLLEAGARVDYVGIGWLISASVSGVVYYG